MTQHRSTTFLILAFGLSLGYPATAAPQPPEPQAQAHTAEQVRRWVSDLNADSFIQREVATKELIDVGVDSIDPLVTALSENNLEVTTRAIYVLRELALSNDPKAEEAARKALEETARPRGTSAARRAGETLEKLDQIREERALRELKRLGAVISEQRTIANNIGFSPGRSIEFGASWHGQVDDLRRLRHIKKIGGLVFEGDRVTDAWLKHVPETEGLDSLTIKRANVTDDGIKHLAGVKGLQWLSLLYVPITDRSVTHLREIPGVSTMRIYGSRMTATGADSLQESLAGTQVDFRQGAFLGVGCQQDENGCVIYTVRPNTAADKGGLQIRDVICEYEGKPVSDFEQLTGMIAKNQAGDTVTIQISRRGEKLEKKITLGQWE